MYKIVYGREVIADTCETRVAIANTKPSTSTRNPVYQKRPQTSESSRQPDSNRRRPAWESDYGLKIQNLASMVFISSFGNYPVFNGLVLSRS
jgi:hypothetical protein